MDIPLEPYEYQKYIANRLLAKNLGNRKNIILQAPTGAGKTHAALLPFLNALEKGRDFPQKCIYSTPMRVLAKQFKDTYTDAVKRAGRDDKIKVCIQTGEQPDDPTFASNLIFATIDQTLSSFLLNPYGLGKRKANLNAAAVMASYLVFDEFHLYDPVSTLPTTLHMLQMLEGITPFILMTATFSADMLDGLAGVLKAEIVQLSPKELAALPSQNKTRRYLTPGYPLNAEAVLNEHHARSLVICNTIDRARALYNALEDATKHTDTEVLLLHSRFLTSDRNTIEDKIRARFGEKDASGGSLIVVSTQAIEVGVDITCERLHTELAPANALIQRAGRCARYEHNAGDVFIYRYVETPDETVDLCDSVLPYREQKAEFERTVAEFSKRSGGALGFAEEQAIISAVHGERDQIILTDLRNTHSAYRRDIYTAMRTGEGANQLIRNAFQQRITISDDPDSLLDSPFDAPAFNVFPYTLEKWVAKWLTSNPENVPWALNYLVEPAREQGQENAPRYEWKRVDPGQSIVGAELLVVNPKLASYDPKLGFLQDVPTPPDKMDELRERFKLPERKKRGEGSRFTYRLETYDDHIAQVYRAAFEYNGMWAEMVDVAARLEKHFVWETGSIKRAAQLAVLLHDVGKLSQKWQGWAREYQNLVGNSTDQNQAYAHTDYDKTKLEHLEAEKKAGKRHPRPWHAVEGAIPSRILTADIFGG